MAYLLQSGLQVSLDYNPSTQAGTWYKLTDHNRQPIEINTEIIESQSRMANGKMRKYVIAQKKIISTSWEFVPSKTSHSVKVKNTNMLTGVVTYPTITEYLTVDENQGAAWLESFYKANVGIPIYLKVITSEIDPDPSLGGVPLESNYKGSATGFKIYNVFMSDFSLTVLKRNPDRKIEDPQYTFDAWKQANPYATWKISNPSGTVTQWEATYPNWQSIKGSDYVDMSIEFMEV